MRSRDRSSPLDLERDLPTTAEDVAALRRVKTIAPLGLEGYLRFLAQFPAPSYQSLRDRPGPGGGAAFELTA